MANISSSGNFTAKRNVKVWDLPTRIFHWAFAAMVLIAFASQEAEGSALAIHVFAGTSLIGFVVFRLVWGIIGSRTVLFADFVYGPDKVTDYATKLFSFRAPFVAGHNPLGGWMVVALLAVVTLASLTGMTLSEDGYVGPLAHLGSVGDLHEGLGTFVMMLVGAHVVGVFAHIVLTRENLARAMVTGIKHAPAGVRALDIRPVGMVRPVIAAALGVAALWLFM